MENEHRLPKGKIITAVLAVVLLAALGIGFLLVRDNVPKEIPEEKDGYTELFATELKNIKRVTVDASEGKATVSQKDGVFSASLTDEKLSQDILKYYLERYTEIYALREIKGGYEKLSEYGIDKNKNYFEIVLSDDSKHRFCIGDFIKEGYYCLREEDKTVWLVPSAFGAELMKLPEVETEDADNLSISIDYENVYYVGVKKAGETVFDIKRISDSTAIPYNFYSAYEITAPFSDIAYTTEFTSFLKSLSKRVTFQGHMGSASENSVKYGIEQGYTLTVKDSAKTHTLRFGNRNDMGVYMTYNDYPYVYLVSDEILALVENANPYDFATPYIDLYPIDDVKEIVIKSGKREHTLTVDNKAKSYSFDESKLSEARFNELFGALTDITAYKGVEANLSKGKVVCEISYKLRDGSKYSRVYYDCNSSMVYMTKKNSGIDATVKKSAIDAMLAMVEDITK